MHARFCTQTTSPEPGDTKSRDVTMLAQETLNIAAFTTSRPTPVVHYLEVGIDREI
jgi:hypothetical protein